MELPFNVMPVPIHIEIAKQRMLITNNGTWLVKDRDNPRGKGWVHAGTTTAPFQNLLMPNAMIQEAVFLRWITSDGDVLPVPNLIPHSFPEEKPNPYTIVSSSKSLNW